jgi:hypothetical protein
MNGRYGAMTLSSMGPLDSRFAVPGPVSITGVQAGMGIAEFGAYVFVFCASVKGRMVLSLNFVEPDLSYVDGQAMLRRMLELIC